MLISGREACAELAAVGITERRARRALLCGLAGEPIRTRSAHLYDDERVRALGARRLVWSGEMNRRCPQGYLVSRRTLVVDADRDELLREFCTGYGGMSPWTRLWLWPIQGGPQRFPLVATVAGFVVLGADIVNIRGDELTVEGPGEWFEGLAGTQLPTGRGRTWRIVGPPGRGYPP